jgi:hypothetical protein
MLFVCDLPVPPLGKFELPEQMVFKRDGHPIASLQYRVTNFQRETNSNSAPPQECEFPDDAVDWPLAVFALETWLQPLPLHQYVIFSGTTVPFFVDPSSFFPLYFLADRLSLPRLQVDLETSLYTFSFPILRQLFLEEQKFRRSLRFPQLHLAMIELLKLLYSPEFLDDLKSLEFTEVIHALPIDPTDWLLAVHEQFWKLESRELYTFEFLSLLQALTITGPAQAFAFWLYAPFFNFEIANSVFAPFVRTFSFSRAFRLSKAQIAWLASQLPLDTIFAQFATNAPEFSVNQLLELFPLFEDHPAARALIFSQCRESAAFSEAVKHFPAVFKYCSWSEITGNFRDDPLLPRYCFKWLKAHNFSGDDEIDYFLNLVAQSPADPVVGFYLLTIYRVARRNVLSSFQNADVLCSTFQWLMRNKRRFRLSSEQISELRFRFELPASGLCVFLKFLLFFQNFNFENRVLLPVSAETFWPTVELTLAAECQSVDELLAPLCDVAAPLFCEMDCTQIRLLSALIPFNDLFRQPSVSVADEDFVLFYASCAIHPDLSLINIPHLSFRMIAKFANFDSFEFSPEPSSPIEQISADFRFNSLLWRAFAPPRAVVFDQVFILDVSVSPVTSYDFSFLGVVETRAIQDVAEVAPGARLIIWQSSQQPARFPLSGIVKDALLGQFQFLINAAAIKTIAEEDDGLEWPLKFEFSDDFADKIDWVAPPSDFRPRGESLPTLMAAGGGGTDQWFGSVSCSVENRGNAGRLVEMKSSRRLFAAKVKDSNIGMFNFDLVPAGGGDELLDWACQKQILLCLKWLWSSSPDVGKSRRFSPQLIRVAAMPIPYLRNEVVRVQGIVSESVAEESGGEERDWEREARTELTQTTEELERRRWSDPERAAAFEIIKSQWDDPLSRYFWECYSEKIYGGIGEPGDRVRRHCECLVEYILSPSNTKDGLLDTVLIDAVVRTGQLTGKERGEINGFLARFGMDIPD